MLGFGLLVGIRWAEHPWVFFGFLSLFALASASLGILLGTLFTDPDKCATTAVWAAILLAPIGGSGGPWRRSARPCAALPTSCQPAGPWRA